MKERMDAGNIFKVIIKTLWLSTVSSGQRKKAERRPQGKKKKKEKNKPNWNNQQV